MAGRSGGTYNGGVSARERGGVEHRLSDRLDRDTNGHLPTKARELTMRKVFAPLLTVLLVACGAVSIRPFYRADQVAFDSSLLGAWGEPKTPEGIVLRPANGQYDIDYTDSDGKHAHFVGQLFRWAGHTAMDVTPGALPDTLKRQVDELYWGLMVRGHWMFWLDHTDTRLAFASLKIDTLKAYVGQHPQAIAYLYSDSSLVFLAATPELQAFVMHFRRTHRLGDSTVWQRRVAPN